MKAYNEIPEWNEINLRKPEFDEEKRDYFDSRVDMLIAENLPRYNTEVLVTDGESIWVDSFGYDDDGIYLSGTGDDMIGVIAWMPLPNPYKGE